MNKFVLTPLSKFVSKENRYKFVHRGFDCIHYILCTIIGVLSFLQRPYRACAFYFGDCRKFNVSTGDFVCSIFQKIYFYVFIGYYLSDVFWIRTTKDIPILCFHHTITLTMLITSILSARPVAGISIMVLHDIVDMFLYSGKIAGYLKIKPLSDTLLVLFATTFVYFRLFNLAIIIYVCTTDKSEQKHGKIPYTLGRVFLYFLYVCHLIWGSQIARAVKKIIFQGDVIHDTRSGDANKSSKKSE